MFLQVHKLDVKGRRVVLNIWVRGVVLAEEDGIPYRANIGHSW
jgi:hypothetical protein